MTKTILVGWVVLGLLAMAGYDATHGARMTAVAAVMIAAANGILFMGG